MKSEAGSVELNSVCTESIFTRRTRPELGLAAGSFHANQFKKNRKEVRLSTLTSDVLK